MSGFDTVLISSTSSEGLNLPFATGSAYVMPAQTVINDVIAFRVKQTVIPRTYFNINAGALTFSMTGDVSGQKTVTLPAGNYSTTDISNYLVSQWTIVAGTTITVDFDQPNFRVLITRTGGIDATISITASDLLSPGMGSILGFYQTQAAGVQVQASNIFNILGPRAINVICYELAGGMGNRNLRSSSTLHNGSDGVLVKSNIIYCVGSLGNGGDEALNIYPSEWYQFANPQNISKLTFDLQDEQGNTIPLNGYAWSICLEIRQKKNV
jgi:hypothetical protein